MTDKEIKVRTDIDPLGAFGFTLGLCIAANVFALFLCLLLDYASYKVLKTVYEVCNKTTLCDMKK